jgi:DivIVA domain-containing protein
MEQVDAFLDAVRDTFTGVRQPPLTAEEIRAKQFATTRLRPGYDEEEVDAFLEDVEARLRVRCAECGAETGGAAQVCVVCGAPAMARPSAAVDPAATALSDTGDHRWSRDRQVALAVLPVVSFTILAWWPFLVLALIRRRARDWVMFAASMAAVAAEIAIITLASTRVLPTAGVPAAVQALPLSTMILLLAVAAPVYLLVAFRPAAALPSLSDAQRARAAERQQPVMDAGGLEGWQ